MAKKENTNAVIEETQESLKKSIKKEKRRKFWGEVGALLVLLGIIGCFVFGTWYWYNYVYDSTKSLKKNKDEDVEQSFEYTLVSYKTEKELQQYANYLVEYYRGEIHKIMDFNTKTLYEGKFEFTSIYEGIDHQFYVLLEENIETENVILLYRFENNTFKEIKSLNESGVFYRPILLEGKLVGFAGSYETIIKEDTKDYFYLLGEEESTIVKDYVLEGVDKNNTHYTILNPSTILVSQYKNNRKYYGIYDMKKERILLPCDYEMLLEVNESTYVATYNGKTGIIDKTGKNLVDYVYDFIEPHEDYYIICKDNKMAIMDTDFTIKTDFIFPYQGVKYSITQPNAFYSTKIKDKILLTVNYDSKNNYLVNCTYVIKPDYSYEVIEAKNFYYGDLFYSYNDQTNLYTIYDEDLNKLYDLDLAKYNYEKTILLRKVNDVTIAAKLDKDIYFSYETGEKLEDKKEPQDKEVSFGDLKLQYHGSIDVSVLYKEEEQFTFKQDTFSENQIIMQDGNYYFPIGSIYYAFIRNE